MNYFLLGIMWMSGGGWDIPHVLHRDSLTFAMNSKSRSTNILTFCVNSFHGAILDLTELILSTTMYLLLSMIKVPLIHANIYIRMYIYMISIYLLQAGKESTSWTLLCRGLKLGECAWQSLNFLLVIWNEIGVRWHSSQLVKHLVIHRVQHVSIPPRGKSRWAATFRHTCG